MGDCQNVCTERGRLATRRFHVAESGVPTQASLAQHTVKFDNYSTSVWACVLLTVVPVASPTPRPQRSGPLLGRPKWKGFSVRRTRNVIVKCLKTREMTLSAG